MNPYNIPEISSIQAAPPLNITDQITEQQRNYPDLKPYWDFITSGVLPDDKVLARRLAFEKDNFVFQDNVLYHLCYPQEKEAKRSERLILQLALPKVFIPEAGGIS